MGEIKELSRSIEGLTALVTGASSGMGRATAYILAEAGARVAVTDINEKGARAVAAEIDEAGGEAHAWKLDVSDAKAITSVVGEVAEHFGRLDILVNNAGVALIAKIDEKIYDEYWDKSVSVMLTAHQRMVRAALPYLRATKNPRIVNIASTEGLGATPGGSAYTAVKHGVIGLTRGLAVELGKEGITVNCICPGPIRTGMTEAIPEDQKEEYARRRTALRRYGYPEEVAHTVLSLVIPAASFITGVALPVDGGLTIRRA